MKLVKLKINKKFRSLFNGFEINFREDKPNKNWEKFHPFCFAGLNGTGKSNVLEALANIFYHLECCTLNENYSEYLKNDFNSKESEVNVYELEYYIIPRDSNKNSFEDYSRIIIKKEDGKTPQICITSEANENLKFQDVANSIRSFLPELVIGYSSGENEILSLPFVKSRLLQFDEYLYHLKENASYLLETKPESSLTYMDYHSSQAILLSNFLLQKEDALTPIKEQLEIEKLHSFRLVINNHRLYNRDEYPGIDFLLPKVEDTIIKLRKCATVNHIENHISGEDKGSIKFEYLDFYFSQKTKDAFKQHFDNPLKLFRAFQVLSLLNLRILDKDLKKEIYSSDSLYAMYKIPAPKEVEHVFHFNLFKLKKENSKDKMLLKAFSDGEHQFLHTMGICLMLQNKSALFLLDEPETHFNPEWRSEFISVLKESLDKSNSNSLMRDILITSHSPFIISDCLPDKVIIFKKKENPTRPTFNTFGTSISIITSKIFKSNRTIGDFSNNQIREFETFFKELNYNDALSILNAKVGDSVEKLLFINEMKNKYNIK
ncbi:restriction system-associated AAA family ATPase [Flavobacterium frigidarium]|jgi:restriction system-associated AAA family ATPase|uniref:Restriction system-associated AAA family ATPase n=1 Tax=Flavobacterium frigidarium TaxID=99286 RepID=A0ABV4KHY7_9FLAO